MALFGFRSADAAGEINLTVMVHRGSGNFEVCDKGVAVARGRVAFLEKDEERTTPTPTLVADQPEAAASGDESIELPLNAVDIYKELRLRGYQYGGLFQGISRASLDGKAILSLSNE